MRIENSDEEKLRLMKEAGCYFIDYGIESGSQKILDVIRKGEKADKIRDKVSSAYRLGINIQGLFMIGLPQETKKDIYETFKLAQALPLTGFHVDIVELFPGSQLSEEVKINSKKWFSGSGILYYPNSNFTIDELNYMSDYIGQRLLCLNIGRIISFCLKANPNRYSFMLIRNMGRYWIKKEYLMGKNPFEEFEKEPFFFKIVNLILKFFYIFMQYVKKTMSLLKYRFYSPNK